MSDVNQMPSGIRSEQLSGKKTWRDYSEVIAAGVMFLIGVSISFGSCARYVAKRANAEEENKNTPAKEQMVGAHRELLMPSFIVR